MDFKILLVDDDPDVIEFLSFNLRNEGFQVSTCSNGKDAVHLAATICPHLIILPDPEIAKTYLYNAEKNVEHMIARVGNFDCFSQGVDRYIGNEG